MAITITLAAAAAGDAPALFDVTEEKGTVVLTAARRVRTMASLTYRGYTIAEASAAVKVAAEQGTVTMVPAA